MIAIATVGTLAIAIAIDYYYQHTSFLRPQLITIATFYNARALPHEMRLESP